jgi:hypothetical protein
VRPAWKKRFFFLCQRCCSSGHELLRITHGNAHSGVLRLVWKKWFFFLCQRCCSSGHELLRITHGNALSGVFAASVQEGCLLCLKKVLQQWPLAKSLCLYLNLRRVCMYCVEWCVMCLPTLLCPRRGSASLTGPNLLSLLPHITLLLLLLLLLVPFAGHPCRHAGG